MAKNASSTEKSNIPVLKLDRSFRNGATKGSVSCVSIRYALNSGDAGDCTNQLRMHCMNSIMINISANQWIARINTKPMHYLHGLLVSWDG